MVMNTWISSSQYEADPADSLKADLADSLIGFWCHQNETVSLDSL